MKKTQLTSYVPAPKWWVTKAIGGEATLILLELINTERMFADDEGWFNCSVNMITKHTGLVKHTILNRVDRLEKIFNFIEKGYRKYRNCNVTCYRIRYDIINAFTEDDCDAVTDGGGLNLDRSVSEGGSACDAPVHVMHPYKNSDDPGIPDPDDRSEKFSKETSSTDVPDYLPNQDNKKKKYKKEKTDSQFSGSDKNETDMIDINNQPEWLDNESPNIDEPVVTLRPMNECVTELFRRLDEETVNVKRATDPENIRIARRHVDEAFMDFKNSSCGRKATERQLHALDVKLRFFTQVADGKARQYSGAVQMTRDELSQRMRQDGYEPHEVKAFMSQQTNDRQPYKVAGAQENTVSPETLKTIEKIRRSNPELAAQEEINRKNASLASSEAHQRTNAPSDDKLSTAQI